MSSPRPPTVNAPEARTLNLLCGSEVQPEEQKVFAAEHDVARPHEAVALVERERTALSGRVYWYRCVLH